MTLRKRRYDEARDQTSNIQQNTVINRFLSYRPVFINDQRDIEDPSGWCFITLGMTAHALDTAIHGVVKTTTTVPELLRPEVVGFSECPGNLKLSTLTSTRPMMKCLVSSSLKPGTLALTA